MYVCLCNAVTEREVRECTRRGCGSLKEGIAHCELVGDYVSREILEDILESEEEHIDFLETQLELLQKVGVQNWLQSWNGAGS